MSRTNTPRFVAGSLGRWFIAAVWLLLVSSGSGASAQVTPFEGLPDIDPAASLLTEGDDSPPLALSAQFTRSEGTTPARLYITADIGKGWHIYSISQPDGGPLATKITLDASDKFRLLEDFTPSPEPARKTEPEAFGDLPIESHEGRVTWYAPIALADGVDPAALKIGGIVNAQACNDTGCLPPEDFKFTAELGPGVPIAENAERAQPAGKEPKSRDASIGTYQAKMSSARIHGHLEPKTVAPGGTAKLVIEAEPLEGYHVYPYAPRDESDVSKPTLIALSDTAGFKIGAVKPSQPPEPLPGDDGADDAHKVYTKPVTWTVDIGVPSDTKPGDYTVSGMIGYQTCIGKLSCQPPQGVAFEVALEVAENEESGELPLEFTKSSYEDAATLAAQVNPSSAELNLGGLTIEGDEELANTPVWLALVFGFLGGLILNLMPCVLPVIGLKVMAFVEQAGQHRSRVLALNVWYSLGMMSLFLVLATLAVFAGFGWGELFSIGSFGVGLGCVVFVMGLSFLGVWEIPIPGFVGSGTAQDLGDQEGGAGAFFKGVITTILATPCTGPFLGSALAWAVLQPAPLTYGVFASVGLGMASPYLLIGAFPDLVKFLPKPGAWMDTFKQAMGFVLLGTVIFIMTFIEAYQVVPMVALMFGLWGACWWINRTPMTEPLPARLRSWAEAAAFAGIIWIIAFPGLDGFVSGRFAFRGLSDVMRSRLAMTMPDDVSQDNDGELPWRPFSQAALDELTRSQQTVMVDFTADWCLVCKTLEATVLNTPDSRQFVKENGIVPLKADWTRRPKEITEMLNFLGSKQVPVLAIFPAGRPNEPIVFRGPYTPSQYYAALKKAGASKTPSDEQATAMR